MKIGDNIQVTISGGQAGTQFGGNGALIGIGPGASMSVPGQIIADDVTHWVVELSISVGGANTVRVPKFSK